VKLELNEERMNREERLYIWVPFYVSCYLVQIIFQY